jgi:hypothetical protein
VFDFDNIEKKEVKDLNKIESIINIPKNEPVFEKNVKGDEGASNNS